MNYKQQLRDAVERLAGRGQISLQGQEDLSELIDSLPDDDEPSRTLVQIDLDDECNNEGRQSDEFKELYRIAIRQERQLKRIREVVNE